MFYVIYMSDIDQNFLSLAQLVKSSNKAIFKNNQWLIRGEKSKTKMYLGENEKLCSKSDGGLDCFFKHSQQC